MTRCAVTSELVHEPMAGTAPEARSWLLLEQSGPWGRQALLESRLDPEIGGALAFRTHDTGVKPLLVRRPGKHADDHHAPAHRAAWIAHVVPGRTWMRRLDVHDPNDLLSLDFAAIGAGDEPTVGVRDDLPLLLVCTNAKRDQCCAVRGRPAAFAAAAAYPDRVWESSHLGGHRFSATALVLPYGFVHGRLDGGSATALLGAADAGHLDLATLRGRTCWSGPGQAAEAFVRSELGLDGVDDVVGVVEVHASEGTWAVEVDLADGRTRTLAVRDVTDTAVVRPESCVKPAVPLRAYSVETGEATR